MNRTFALLLLLPATAFAQLSVPPPPGNGPYSPTLPSGYQIEKCYAWYCEAASQDGTALILNNPTTNAVPEIDPSGAIPALTLLAGLLVSFLPKRTRNRRRDLLD